MPDEQEEQTEQAAQEEQLPQETEARYSLPVEDYDDLVGRFAKLYAETDEMVADSLFELGKLVDEFHANNFKYGKRTLQDLAARLTELRGTEIKERQLRSAMSVFRRYRFDDGKEWIIDPRVRAVLRGRLGRTAVIRGLPYESRIDVLELAEKHGVNSDDIPALGLCADKYGIVYVRQLFVDNDVATAVSILRSKFQEMKSKGKSKAGSTRKHAPVEYFSSVIQITMKLYSKLESFNKVREETVHAKDQDLLLDCGKQLQRLRGRLSTIIEETGV